MVHMLGIDNIAPHAVSLTQAEARVLSTLAFQLTLETCLNITRPHPPVRKKGRKRKTQKPEDCLEFILLNKNVTFV